MKKEVFIAVFVGLTMGLIITFGFFRVSRSITDTPVSEFIDESNSDTDATATPTILALHNPEDGIIQSEAETTVTGTTIADSYIVLFVNDTDYISTSDESGNFSFTVDLEAGANILRVHVIDREGTISVEERLVVVSTALEDIAEARAAAEASAAAQATQSAETEDSEETEE